MTDLSEVIELIEEIIEDKSIPKNVRSALKEIKESFESNNKEIGIKIDSAMQTIEDISLDPNMSPYARTQIWNLTSLLESITD